jgi:Zn finger protein HypA/HybF involved in hydrogenase expression
VSVKIECKNCDRVFEEKKGETILHCPYCKSNLAKD